MTKIAYTKWIHWSLWIKPNGSNNFDDNVGVVFGCYVDSGLITFITERGEFAFLMNEGLATTAHTSFTGADGTKAKLLPPSKV